jgi:hypothetical protein
VSDRSDKLWMVAGSLPTASECTCNYRHKEFHQHVTSQFDVLLSVITSRADVNVINTCLVLITLTSTWTIGVLGFDSRRGLGIFLFITASRTALGPTQPPIQWAPGALSLEVKRPGREADHSSPSSAEVKE